MALNFRKTSAFQSKIIVFDWDKWWLNFFYVFVFKWLKGSSGLGEEMARDSVPQKWLGFCRLAVVGLGQSIPINPCHQLFRIEIQPKVFVKWVYLLVLEDLAEILLSRNC